MLNESLNAWCCVSLFFNNIEVFLNANIFNVKKKKRTTTIKVGAFDSWRISGTFEHMFSRYDVLNDVVWCQIFDDVWLNLFWIAELHKKRFFLPISKYTTHLIHTNKSIS